MSFKIERNNRETGSKGKGGREEGGGEGGGEGGV